MSSIRDSAFLSVCLSTKRHVVFVVNLDGPRVFSTCFSKLIPFLNLNQDLRYVQLHGPTILLCQTRLLNFGTKIVFIFLLVVSQNLKMLIFILKHKRLSGLDFRALTPPLPSPLYYLFSKLSGDMFFSPFIAPTGDSKHRKKRIPT